MLISIDVGSSFLKLGVLDEKNKTSVEYTKYRMQRMETEFTYKHEYDMTVIIGYIKNYISEKRNSYNVKGIMISTQMHGFIIESGTYCTNYISWQDERSLNQYINGITVFDYLKKIIPHDILSISGLRLKCELALCNLKAYLTDTDTDNEKYTFYTIGSYIIKELTGNNIIHITNAAATGMYDIINKVPNYSLLQICGLDKIELPEIATNISPCGVYNEIPVYPDVGDHQCAVYGSGTLDGMININMGTASQISMICTDYDTSYYDNIYEIRPYFNDIYVKTVSKLPGGRSLQVLVNFFKNVVEFVTNKQLTESEIWQKIDKIDLSIETSLSINTGFYQSLHTKDGSIKDITAENMNVENIIRASYKNITDIFINMIDIIDISKKTTKIILCGKFADKLYVLLKKSSKNHEISIYKENDAVMAGLIKLYNGSFE